MYSARLYTEIAPTRSAATTPSYAAMRACQRAQNRDAAMRKAARLRTYALLFVCLIVLAIPMFMSATHAEGQLAGLSPMPMESYLVAPGDTLWDIAICHPIEGLSIQENVYWLMNQNNLSDALLTPGQIVVVPTASV